MASYSSFDIGGHVVDVHKAPADGKAHLAAKIVYGDRHVSFVTADGKVFSTRVGAGKWYVGKRWGGCLDLIRDVIALGVVPKAAAAQRLVKAEEARRARQRRAYAALQVLCNFEKAGVPIADRHVRALRRRARSANRA